MYDYQQETWGPIDAHDDIYWKAETKWEFGFSTARLRLHLVIVPAGPAD